MPRKVYRPEPLQWQIFRGSQAISDGWLTPGQLRSPAWRRIRRDVYQDSRVEHSHVTACRALAMTTSDRLVFAGTSAALLHGVRHAAGPHDTVHVIMDPGAKVTRHEGVRLHETVLRPADQLLMSGLACTTAVRTAWDLAVFFRIVIAVPIIDSLLGMGLVTEPELAEFLRSQGRRGSRRAAQVFELADPGAQSPKESVLRVHLVQAGLPRPVTQLPITVRGGVVYHPDLAWPEYRVAVEYDGLWHADPDQLHRDRERLNRLVEAGWLVLHVTSRRLHTDAAAVVREVGRALKSRGWQG